jgi:hypothetical protein
MTLKPTFGVGHRFYIHGIVFAILFDKLFGGNSVGKTNFREDLFKVLIGTGFDS